MAEKGYVSSSAAERESAYAAGCLRGNVSTFGTADSGIGTDLACQTFATDITISSSPERFVQGSHLQLDSDRAAASILRQLAEHLPELQMKIDGCNEPDVRDVIVRLITKLCLNHQEMQVAAIKSKLAECKPQLQMKMDGCENRDVRDVMLLQLTNLALTDQFAFHASELDRPIAAPIAMRMFQPITTVAMMQHTEVSSAHRQAEASANLQAPANQDVRGQQNPLSPAADINGDAAADVHVSEHASQPHQLDHLQQRVSDLEGSRDTHSLELSNMQQSHRKEEERLGQDEQRLGQVEQRLEQVEQRLGQAEQSKSSLEQMQNVVSSQQQAMRREVHQCMEDLSAQLHDVEQRSMADADRLNHSEQNMSDCVNRMENVEVLVSSQDRRHQNMVTAFSRRMDGLETEQHLMNQNFVAATEALTHVHMSSQAPEEMRIRQCSDANPRTIYVVSPGAEGLLSVRKFNS